MPPATPEAGGTGAALRVEVPVTDPAPAHDARLLRTALGRYATGVTIVTCVDPTGSGYVGLTVNSFTSLSMAPPLVLWSLREGRHSMSAFEAAPRFAVNVLSEGQVELSRRFASRHDDKFAEGTWTLGRHGSPLLAGCSAVFECALQSQQPAGDHRLFIGRVLAFEASAAPPLLFHGGHYHGLGGVTS